jgi:polyhydroxyalkanoate synthesis regulator phasin
MSTFRQYGGLSRSANSNIVRNNVFNADVTTLSQNVGLPNTKVVTESHIDLSGNSLLNVDGIYFTDGTTLMEGVFSGGLAMTSGNMNMVGNAIVDVGKITFENGSELTNNKFKGNLTISGNLTVQNNIVCYGTMNSLSDYRIKEDVISLPNHFSVDKLRPVIYTNKITSAVDTGFVAHEVQQVMPHLVQGEKDSAQYQTVNYIALIAVLTKEIQELKKRVVQLEESIF